MASIHVFIDTQDRQWANPPNMKGVYHAHVDTSDLDFIDDDEIQRCIRMLTLTLHAALVGSDTSPGSEFEVYDNADGGMRKVMEE